MADAPSKAAPIDAKGLSRRAFVTACLAAGGLPAGAGADDGASVMSVSRVLHERPGRTWALVRNLGRSIRAGAALQTKQGRTFHCVNIKTQDDHGGALREGNVGLLALEGDAAALTAGDVLWSLRTPASAGDQRVVQARPLSEPKGTLQGINAMLVYASWFPALTVEGTAHSPGRLLLATPAAFAPSLSCPVVLEDGREILAAGTLLPAWAYP